MAALKADSRHHFVRGDICDQAQVLALFQQRLGYRYLGHWAERKNSNIELELLKQWLQRRGVAAALISRALHELTRVASDSSKGLYDRNKAVYEMLRYGIKVQAGMGENQDRKSVV